MASPENPGPSYTDPSIGSPRNRCNEPARAHGFAFRTARLRRVLLDQYNEKYRCSALGPSCSMTPGVLTSRGMPTTPTGICVAGYETGMRPEETRSENLHRAREEAGWHRGPNLLACRRRDRGFQRPAGRVGALPAGWSPSVADRGQRRRCHQPAARAPAVLLEVQGGSRNRRTVRDRPALQGSCVGSRPANTGTSFWGSAPWWRLS